MAHGFLGGIIVGTMVSGLGLGVASVITEIPARTAPEAAALEVPAGSEFNQSREDEPVAMTSEPDTVPLVEGAPEVSTSAPDDLSVIEDADMQPAAVPQTGEAQANLSAPQVATDDNTVNFGQDDAAVLPSPQSAAPDAPGSEEELSISVDPAQPMQPAVDAESAAFPKEEADAPQISAIPDTTESTETDVDIEAMVKPEVTAPSGTIGDLATGIATNRLPSVTDAPAEAETASDISARPDSARRAIDAHATPFDNPDGKPLMAIVLIDDGSSPIGLEALSNFPYPLSFAVDAAWDGATAAMKRYRDAGFEVLVMVNLPPGAQASDTEIAMQTVLNAVPEAVAVLEGTDSGLQSGRAAAEQLAPILLESGHGLVLFPNGLDTARKLIEREGVPTGSVFRDFDSKGQNATVIRRFLDQAAFKAGRGQGEVIMLGRLQADTISALLLWGLQDRANSVAIAPVSAVLTQEH
nr:divergent polysaccharide deacetylase family protein [Pseudohalocynthiibacter aestuariivivens]